MRLGFYEKVRITNSQRFPEYNGKIGVMVGISEENGKIYSYSVSFPEEESCMFRPEELVSTGEFADPRDFHDENDRIRVRVVGEKAFIVE